MNFPSIDLQGSILSIDLFSNIQSEQASFQQGKDFYPEMSNAKLKDEISLVWQEAKGQWNIYKSKLSRLKEGDTGTTETRNFWISPLLTNLGYNLTFNRQSEELAGKLFPIGYRDSSRDNFPIYIGGYNESLDKRPQNKQLRVSPHGMLQEYLNYSEHLYGLVTNGRQIRLLRDASRITRLSYVEFDLEKIMEEDLYYDFLILYRVLHASRMPLRIDEGAESIIEKYHQEGLEAGSTIRSKLGDAVKAAILNLANGFFNHPENIELRKIVADGKLNNDDYYRHLLRIIYRLLFLFVIEERNLVYANSKTPETKRFHQIYFNYYSLFRLRKLAKKLLSPDAEKYSDLWHGLLSTFSLFEQTEIGEKLGIMSLKGDLFGYNAISNQMYDLHQCKLSNSILLKIIKSLSYFENDNRVLISVNYGKLDVEEFGSVYEGLLELKLTVNKIEGRELYSCSFDTSQERGKSGSHYTPEELVQPLIKHSLEYLIEDRTSLLKQNKNTKDETIKSLLDLKICDVACGSGHILLSAARRVSLEIARLQTEEDQPNPLAIRKAMKDVVRSCIYGVDKNPLAVELCKIALWLEAYNPGEPLNFLDHHIKCGDAIVGLAHKEELNNGIATEAFKTLPDDDKEIAAKYRNANKKQRDDYEKGLRKLDFEALEKEIDEFSDLMKKLNHLPERTPEEVEKKKTEYGRMFSGSNWWRLKTLADVQVAQFFISKTIENEKKLITDEYYRKYLNSNNLMQGEGVAKATAIALEKRFFHYFLEFPEIFVKGGFDCILGNPPFLGGKRISGNYGDHYLSFLKFYFHPDHGITDLVAYFFRRIYLIIREESYQALISTNTIAQGGTRETALEEIINQKGNICFAIKSMRWPGIANVEVTLLSLLKNATPRKMTLNGKNVSYINSYLSSELETNPKKLFDNRDKAFIGSIILGDGFILDISTAKDLISDNTKNKEVLYPYLIGADLNGNPDQKPSRWVINFHNYELEKAKLFKTIFSIIEKKVKPQRDLVKRDVYRNIWWLYAEKCSGLYNTISKRKYVLTVAQVSRTLAFAFVENDCIFSAKVVVFNFDRFIDFAILQSVFHSEWAWKYCTTMKSDLSYGPTTIFQTFPFPQNIHQYQKQKLESNGETYHEQRRQLMLDIQLGLTKTYNLFHSKKLSLVSDNEEFEAKVFEKKYGKDALQLRKHLEKTPDTIGFNEAVERIKALRDLHKEMDEAVLEAYGWHEDTEKWGKAIQLNHDFYEVDYLPENDNIRYTIHPEARKEVLKRLLLLNHEMYEEEIKQGLHKKADVVKFYEQKGIPIPPGIEFSDSKGKTTKKLPTQTTKPNQVQESKVEYKKKEDKDYEEGDQMSFL